MEELKGSLGLSNLNEDWCNDMLKDDFCTYSWPESWTYDKSLLGLEDPFRDLLKCIRKRKQRIWDHIVLSDVSRLQCVTNIVLESCINLEGSSLTGLLCGACYVSMSAIEGASARNVYHNMLFGKIMELLKVQDDPSCFEGVLALYDSLSELLKSDVTIPDQSYWLLVKASLTSVNINCSQNKARNSSFDILFAAILTKPKEFKFFIKEASVYLLAGKSYVGDRCSSLIHRFVQDNSEAKRVNAHHLNLVQTLCASISDRTETRKQVEVYILKLIKVLPSESFFGFVDWVATHLCFSQKVVHRIFGVEMCFQLSFNGLIAEPEDSEVLVLLYQSIVSALSDKAPTVRAKSAMVLSDLLKNATQNGRQSFSSYFEPSHTDNILHVIQLLSSDEKSSVRKATCSLLLMMLMKIKIRSSWLKIIYRLCLDTAVSVRKQALMSVCQLLAENESNPVTQRLWLETVLPAANDNENSVKDFCNLQLQNLLDNLHKSEHAWDILQLIAHPKSLDLQTYFDFGIQNLRDYKMSGASKKYLQEKLMEPQYTQTVLLVISRMMNQFKEIHACLLMDIFEKCLLSTRADESYQTMCMVLTCIRNQNEVDTADEIVNKLKSELQKYAHPYVVIKEIIATIANLLQRSNKKQLLSLCEDSISKIGIVLQNICLSRSADNIISSLKLCCYLFTLGEISMHFTKSIGNNIIISVKELIIGNEESVFSTSVRAHAIIALGKICLVHEDIAKDSVMLFSKVLEDDKHYEVRNNILIVLGDLIVRYPTIIAEYLYCVTDCLQDSSTVVRRQAIIVLTKLLQEDYLKWRSGIVMKFISNLVSDDAEIRQLCELCLSNILLVRYPKTYFDFFIEVVFFANGLFSFLSATEPNLLHFSLPGQENEVKRRKIYTAMLQNLGDQQKLEITSRICKEILTLFVAENDDPIDKKLIPLLQDSLWILCCPSLKLSSLKTRACHDFDDDDTKVGMIEAQTKVISNIVKRNFVENCTPIIILLRQKLKKLKSPLQQDMTKFIVSFMTEYKNEIEVLSGADAQFIAEIQYDIDEVNKREDGAAADSVLQKTVYGNLMTPGFLKAFKTPHTGRALNLSLANGPGMFLNSPLFTAPTPYSISKSVALYTRPQRHVINEPQNILRKNLISDFTATGTTTVVISQKVLIRKSTEGHADNKQSQQAMESQSKDNISVETESVHYEMEDEDQEISYTENTTTIKIVNSPVPPREFKDNAQEVVGIKQELMSPSQLANRKQGRNLYNPDTSANLQNASQQLEGSQSEKSRSGRSREALLLTNKADKGCVRVVKMENAKRVLITPEYPTSSSNDATETQPQPANNQAKKPFLLGQLIKEKLREQRRRKAEQEKSEKLEQDMAGASNDNITTRPVSSQVNKSANPIDPEASINKHPEAPVDEEAKDDGLQDNGQMPLVAIQEKVDNADDERYDTLQAKTLSHRKEPEPKQHVENKSEEQKKTRMYNKVLNQFKPIAVKKTASDKPPENIKPPQASDDRKEAGPEPNEDPPKENYENKSEGLRRTRRYNKVFNQFKPVAVKSADPVQEKQAENPEPLLVSDNRETTPPKQKSPVKPPQASDDRKEAGPEPIEDPPKENYENKTEGLRRTRRYNKVFNQFKPVAIKSADLAQEKQTENPEPPQAQVSDNRENTPPKQKSPVKEQNQIKRRSDSQISKVLKQFQPKKTAPQEPTALFQKPAAPAAMSSKRRVNKLLAQLKPKAPPVGGNIIDKPENILLANQVLRKRKIPNTSGHYVYQEDDLPKAKRRSIDNYVNLGNVSFDKNHPQLVTSTPAVPAKIRRSSERLMRKNNISFNHLDPSLVTSTPFVSDKVVSKNILSSTPAVTTSSKRLQMMCNLSPVTSDRSQKK